MNCEKTADWTWMPFEVVSAVGWRMGVLNEGGDRRMGRGSIGGKCGAFHCNQWGICGVVILCHEGWRGGSSQITGSLGFVINISIKQKRFMWKEVLFFFGMQDLRMQDWMAKMITIAPFDMSMHSGAKVKGTGWNCSFLAMHACYTRCRILWIHFVTWLFCYLSILYSKVVGSTSSEGCVVVVSDCCNIIYTGVPVSLDISGINVWSIFNISTLCLKKTS